MRKRCITSLEVTGLATGGAAVEYIVLFRYFYDTEASIPYSERPLIGWLPPPIANIRYWSAFAIGVKQHRFLVFVLVLSGMEK